MDYIFWEHDRLSDEKEGIKFEVIGKQLKQTKKKKMAKQSPGFSTKMYKKQVEKATDKFKDNTKVVKLTGIQSKDQRSSNEYNTRVGVVKPKPRSVTYGASKGNKGTTVYKKGKV